MFLDYQFSNFSDDKEARKNVSAVQAISSATDGIAEICIGLKVRYKMNLGRADKALAQTMI